MSIAFRVKSIIVAIITGTNLLAKVNTEIVLVAKIKVSVKYIIRNTDKITHFLLGGTFLFSIIIKKLRLITLLNYLYIRENQNDFPQ